MRSRVTALVAGLGVLAGCQAKVAGTVAVAPSAAPSAAPKASATPGATASAKAPARQPAALLQAPAGATKLAGRVLFDARYAVQVAGATALGGDRLGVGGAKLAKGDGSPLLDGSTLIGNDGSTLVSASGGNVIVPASLIGNDGSTLIGNDGSTLIGNDGSTYKLVLAAGAAAQPRVGGPHAGAGAPAYGTRWPAAGAWIQVVDLRTGRAAPVGVDAAGKPVYAVYSDLAGGYELYLDPELVPYARLVARESATPAPGMILTALPGVMAAGGDLDDDAAAVTGYVRYVLARKLIGILGMGLARDRGTVSDQASESVAQVVNAQMAQARKVVEELGMTDPSFTDAQRIELGLLLADIALSQIKFQDLTLLVGPDTTLRDPNSPNTLVGKNVVTELKAAMKAFREATIAALPPGADPAAHYAAKPWLIALNRRLPEDQRYRLDRAADLPELLIKEFFSEVSGTEQQLGLDVLSDLDMGAKYRDLFGMGTQALLAGFVGLFADPAAFGGQDPNDVFIGNLRRLAPAVKGMAARPAAARQPALPLPAIPARVQATVTTVAGQRGVAGVADGPGAAASFGSIEDLAVDPRPGSPVLYVADDTAARIRRITFDAAGAATVTTVAGQAGAALAGGTAVDGPGALATFHSPRGLTCDAQGRLYVTERFSHRVRRLTFDAAGLATVETLVGPTTPTGGDPALGEPMDVLVLANGDLLIADAGVQALRLLRAGGTTLEWLSGSRLPLATQKARRIEGKLADAWFETPFALAPAPGGATYLLELGSQALRRLDGLGTPAARTTLLLGGGPSKAPLEGTWGLVETAAVAGLGLDPQGRAVIADSHYHHVRLAWPDGYSQILAGGRTPGDAAGGHVDGAGDAARFNYPRGVAVAADGTIFVADQRNFLIRRITTK